jgi:hypothetical protein
MQEIWSYFWNNYIWFHFGIILIQMLIGIIIYVLQDYKHTYIRKDLEYDEPWFLASIIPLLNFLMLGIHLFILYSLLKDNYFRYKVYVINVVYFLPILMLGLLWCL